MTYKYFGGFYIDKECLLVDFTDKRIIKVTKKENILILLELLREHQVLVFEDNINYSSSSHIKYVIENIDFTTVDDTSVLTETIISNFNKHMPASMRNNLSDIVKAVIFGCFVVVSDAYYNLGTYTRLQYAKERINDICKGTKRTVKFTHLWDSESYGKDLFVYEIGDLPSFAEVLSRGMFNISLRTQKELDMLSILKKYKSTNKPLG